MSKPELKTLGPNCPITIEVLRLRPYETLEDEFGRPMACLAKVEALSLRLGPLLERNKLRMEFRIVEEG